MFYVVILYWNKCILLLKEEVGSRIIGTNTPVIKYNCSIYLFITIQFTFLYAWKKLSLLVRVLHSNRTSRGVCVCLESIYYKQLFHVIIKDDKSNLRCGLAGLRPQERQPQGAVTVWRLAGREPMFQFQSKGSQAVDSEMLTQIKSEGSLLEN